MSLEQQQQLDGESINPATIDETGEDEASSTEGEVVAVDGEVIPAAGDTTEDETVVVTIGDEQPVVDEIPPNAPPWVKDLRKANREKDRIIRDLNAKLAAVASAEPAQAEVLPPKPKLEDFDFDPDEFEKAFVDWQGKKAKHEEAQARTQKERQAAEESWAARVNEYNKLKTALKVPDYADAELVVQDRFTPTQQGIIVQALDNPALVVYAIGKNEKKAEELAAIKDPVKFAVAVAKLETQLKVTPRKAPPAPPRVASGTAPVSGTTDQKLERLRAEAEKTGDYTKVAQYRRQMRQGG